MNNCKFTCYTCKDHTIDLEPYNDQALKLTMFSNGMHQMIHLDKQDLIRLAAEISSWCETGDFIKPKKQYLAIIEMFLLEPLIARQIKTFKIEAPNMEGATIEAVCKYIPNPNERRLIGILEYEDYKK